MWCFSASSILWSTFIKVSIVTTSIFGEFWGWYWIKTIKEKWVLYLRGESEKKVWGCIKIRTSTKHWKHWKTALQKLNKPLSKYRIGTTFSTSIDVIVRKLYSGHSQNINLVHKYTKDLVSVIISLGNNISGVYKVLYDRVKWINLGKRDHVLKHSH